MAKPSTLPRWNTDGSNRTTPGAGQLDSGWAEEQEAVSSYFNWLGYYTYLWLKWVDDGAWTAVSLALSGAFSAASAAISGALTAASAAISGNASVGGTFTLTGEDYHGERIDQVSFLEGRSQSGSWTRSGSSYITGTTGSIWEIPIRVRRGDRLKAWSVGIEYDGGTDTITARLKKNVNGAVTTVGSAVASGTPGVGFAGPASISHTLVTPDVVAAGETFWLEIEQNATASGMRAYGAQWTRDRIP